MTRFSRFNSVGQQFPSNNMAMTQFGVPGSVGSQFPVNNMAMTQFGVPGLVNGFSFPTQFGISCGNQGACSFAPQQ